ncbi:HipA family kinase [Thalassospira alkalitolerans]|uniref:HipA family kinase n=1 Tax=Thalassospira alkalitolerans TaxID=1293890 RepID=UPI003AA96D3D
MREIQLSRVLEGAVPFNENNVNSTFRGPVLTEDGETKLAVIKDLNLTQLCNELIASCLAEEFDLPVPKAMLGLVGEGVLDLRLAPQIENQARLVFVSLDVKVPNLSYKIRQSTPEKQSTIIDKVRNWDQIGGLYAYDSWIANVDRHAGNLLFGEPDEIWLIDHGHSFTGPNWNLNDLVPHKEYDNRLSEWLTKLLTAIQKQAGASGIREFSNKIENYNADAVMRDSRVAEILSSNASQALKEFLEQRVQYVLKHASAALGAPVLV